jgi:hypothetical protein
LTELLCLRKTNPSNERSNEEGDRLLRKRVAFQVDNILENAETPVRFLRTGVVSARVPGDEYDQRGVTSEIFGAATSFHIAFGGWTKDSRSTRRSSIGPAGGRVLMLWKPKGDVEFVNLTMVTLLEGKKLPEDVSE